MTQIPRERLPVRERELRRFGRVASAAWELVERAGRSTPNRVPMAWMATLYEHPPNGVEAVARVVAERVAAGPQFLLGTEDGVEVAVELARRFSLPSWQFTLSATQANMEAIRVARAATGRNAVPMFDGKYHGHADELLGELDGGTVVPEGAVSRPTRRATCAWSSTRPARRRRRVFVSGRQEPGSRRTRKRLARYRTGAEGRSSHLKRSYGLRRSRLGNPAQRTWTGWGILSPTTSTRSPSTAPDTLRGA